MMDDASSLDRSAFSVTTLSDPFNDRAYWQSQSPAQRLAAVEQLRQLNDEDDPAERLQRVLETVRREGR
jgi:hypothetical protein